METKLKPRLATLLGLRFKTTQTGSWVVFLRGERIGKVWKSSKGWRALCQPKESESFMLPGEFPTRTDAGAEMKIHMAEEVR